MRAHVQIVFAHLSGFHARVRTQCFEASLWCFLSRVYRIPWFSSRTARRLRSSIKAAERPATPIICPSPLSFCISFHHLLDCFVKWNNRYLFPRSPIYNLHRLLSSTASFLPDFYYLHSFFSLSTKKLFTFCLFYVVDINFLPHKYMWYFSTLDKLLCFAKANIGIIFTFFVDSIYLLTFISSKSF